MRAVWLGLLGFLIGWIAMYVLGDDPLHLDNPARLILSVAAGIVCGGVGWTAANSQARR